ncbi:MAG: glycosyltransferase [Gemmatimonadetes bacterium]|nr:glycosyltransferase [Gemmatimonadota bacterium]
MLVGALLAMQSLALLVLAVRLAPGRTRRAATPPHPAEITDTTVSVIVPTLNEAQRIGPCLAGLRTQPRPLLEVLIVDSGSSDGTRELVADAAAIDPRVRLLSDDPRPPDWVGKVWALEQGLRAARGEWVLGIDADVEPQPGLVAGVVAAAREAGYSVVSFAPRFAAQSAWEQLLQPALLLTLVYRGGTAGTERDPERLMANGQCFLARRDALLRHGGYAPARESFADDVTLARHLARQGERVGFLDGSRLYLVRSYRSAREMWREWGRSLDLRQATSATRQWLDVLFLIAVQGLPLPMLVLLAIGASTSTLSSTARLLAVVNGVLLGIHLLLLRPLSHSYERPGPSFWLSWITDPLAVVRIVLSTLQQRRQWRGRSYARRP